MIKKRVACFYRVSTKQQVVENDIPAQRNACLSFIAQHNDWEYTAEYLEKGVSGYKTRAQDREVLETLKEDALKNKFDIILVFMFDRIGRIEEETPFVLKYFVDLGIEMWSVKEGQRTLENHVDNLLNYITFWQASGESKKTQIRTKEVKDQMVDEGKYLGCAPALGYKHEFTGEYNKKGRALKKLIIDENEAGIVRMIFDLSTIKGYGSRRIAKELNELNIPTKRGGNHWAGATVMGILKNSIYKGYFMYGRYASTKTSKGKRLYQNQSECIISEARQDDLVIISDEQWDDAQKIISSRASKDKTNIPKQTNSPLLFTGFIYCGKCKSRMTLHYSYSHNIRKDGSKNKNRRAFYSCYGKINGICDTKDHSSDKIEGIVLKQVYKCLEKIEKLNVEEDIKRNQKDTLKKYERDIKQKNDSIKIIEDDLKLFKNEIINVLKGTSNFTTELLNEQIEAKKVELEKEHALLDECTNKLNNVKYEQSENLEMQKYLSGWKDNFESADLETKKMLLTKIIKELYVDTEISITMDAKIERMLELNGK
jgi:DNA invertase Pin-like site-specific DNA recombinase